MTLGVRDRIRLANAARRSATAAIKHDRPDQRDDCYTAGHTAATEVHFPLGDSWLTELGRQHIRFVCAKELRWLREPDTRLGIIGHTDRVDDEESNQVLSERRSKNTLQAFEDILAEDFGVDTDDPQITQVFGMGEQEAKKAGRRDGFPWQADRRVEVVLNGRLIASQPGADRAPADESPPAHLRRTYGPGGRLRFG
jgi:outer membrane protein OmpA-like peptidoglycan-associated protein